MITKQDIQIIRKIQKKIDQDTIKSNEIDWDSIHKINVLDKIINNLQIAHLSYRPASQEDISHNYFTAQCENCGWWGSSKLLNGGGAIADTGDHFDTTCPVCDNSEIDEKL